MKIIITCSCVEICGVFPGRLSLCHNLMPPSLLFLHTADNGCRVNSLLAPVILKMVLKIICSENLHFLFNSAFLPVFQCVLGLDRMSHFIAYLCWGVNPFQICFIVVVVSISERLVNAQLHLVSVKYSETL